MLRSIVYTGFMLLCTAACTQQPVQVDFKGQQSFGRNGGSGGMFGNNTSFSSAAPSSPSYANVSTSTEQSATVQTIGVQELAPAAGGNSSMNKSSSPPPARLEQRSGLIWQTGPSGNAVNTVSSNNEMSNTAAPNTAASHVVASNNVSEHQPVNLWTGKPRSDDSSDEAFNLRPQKKSSGEPMVADIKPAAEMVSKKTDTADRLTAKGKEEVPAAKASKVATAGFIWPVNSKKVLSGFGPKGGGKANDGINIASAEGEPVWASADGEVIYVGNELAGYGTMVLIKHAQNKTTTYAHLNRASVDKYQRVKQGDIIGYVGSTGNAKDPQLHFGIRDGKDPVDPQKYLNRSMASAQ